MLLQGLFSKMPSGRGAELAINQILSMLESVMFLEEAAKVCAEAWASRALEGAGATATEDLTPRESRK